MALGHNMYKLFLAWLKLRLNIPDEPCATCEILKYELEVERARSNLLLDKITGINRQVIQPEIEDEPSDLKPLPIGRRKFVPFAVRQQMMEQNDLHTLKILQDKYAELHSINLGPTPANTSNEELEKEITGDATGNTEKVG